MLMNIVNVSESPAITNYIVITQQGDINETITNTVYVTDSLTGSPTNLIEVTRGIQGFDGPAGKDGIIFDILPIASGGTNNSTFESNKIIYYDGNKFTSSNYNISDVMTGGVVAGTGMVVVNSGGSVVIHSNLGSGLYVTNNKIAENRVLNFSPLEIWNGIRTKNKVLCNGLIDDWIKWQNSKYRTKNVGSREKEKNWVEKD
jgi:hypothetical protein